MTNTRVMDPEILEKRMPVLIRMFGLRPGSGGKGLHRGGDGAIRVFEPRCKMTFTVNTDRRVTRPYGMAGGQPGEAGLNLAVLDHPSGKKRVVNFGPRGILQLQQGEQLHIHTPGGGGWGTKGTDCGSNGVVVNGDTSSAPQKTQVISQYPRGTGSLHQYTAAQLEG